MTSRTLVKPAPSKRRRSRGRRDGRLYIAPGKRDAESLRSAIRTWIVPVLVRQFLKEQTRPEASIEVNSSSRSTKPVDKEDAGAARMS